jgi:hypothetical protein
MNGPPVRGWEAVEHADERVRERAMARQRKADRRRRRRSGSVWVLRILLPVLGAAAMLALLGSEGGDWPPAAGAAILLAPALVSAATARRDGPVAVVLWLLLTLAAEVALVFGVGLVALGLGPS